MSVWKRTIDLSHVSRALSSFPDRRDEIIKVIRNSGWDNDELSLFLDELADTTDEKSFDDVFVFVYDAADRDRVWIETYE
jgi:hypothetical protein